MDILESNAAIEKLIVSEVEKHFFDTWNSAEKTISSRIQSLYISAIKAQPEYDSLLRGRLYGEFGLTDPVGKLNTIIDIWAKSIQTRRTKRNFYIEAINKDFQDVLSTPEAKQYTNKGQALDWLDWLLLQGDKTIIRDYQVEFNVGGRSRTGLAVMTMKPKSKWGVPSQYAGTINNNWITRAIDAIQDSTVEDIISNEILNRW